MSRRLHTAVAVLFGVSVFLSLGAEGSCGGSADLKVEGEACTRNSECETGLACSGGTCRLGGDAGTDAAGGDAAP